MSTIAIYASLLGLVLIYLSLCVIKYRRSERVDIGTGDSSALERLIRAQANFIEYVPMALVLLFLLAQLGAATWLLHTLGAALLVGRCLHAVGFVKHIGTSFGRVAGTLLTYFCIIVAALTNLYLALF